ncbi:MAG: HAMP domain-containing sensor histidine kinase [Nitriliruptoraceae bacterium]
MNQRTPGDILASFEGTAGLPAPAVPRRLKAIGSAALGSLDARARSGQRPLPRPPRSSRRFALPSQVSLPAIVATLTITTLATVAIALPGAGTPSPSFDQAGANAALQAGSSMLAIMCGAVLVAFARYGDHVASAWIGAAVLVLGAATLGTGAIGATFGADVDPGVLTWIQPGSRAGVIVVLLVALATSRRSDIWRRRPSRVALVTTVSVAIGLLTAAAAPSAIAPFASVGDLAGMLTHPVDDGLIVVWTLVTVVYAVVATRRRDALLGWIALALLAFATAEAARVGAATMGLTGSVAAHSVQTAGLAVLLIGVIRGLAQSVQTQRLQLLRRAVHAETAADDNERRQRAQVHEARNALGGVVNTLRLLDADQVKMDDGTQRDLLAASFAELLRLQRVFSLDEASQAATPYRLVDALGSVLAASRAGGMTLDVDIPDEVTAFGSWAATAQAVQNLLENSRRYAPGSRVTISARTDDEHVLLSVIDHGPGLADDETAAVFQGGVRGSASHGTPGSGLGLTITRELMARQGGTIYVEATPGGGATFVLQLPATQASPVVVTDRDIPDRETPDPHATMATGS